MTRDAAPKPTTQDPPTLEARYLTGEYLKQAPGWHVSDSVWKARKIVEILARNSLSPQTICDVGCGAGEVLVELQKSVAPETRLAGYEIAPQAMAICAPKTNARLSFHHANFLTDSAETFDLLLLLDVFEHVPDYLGFLAALRDRADHFVFHIPLDLSLEAMLHRVSPMIYMRKRYGHLHYFTADTALATLEDAGYAVRDVLYTWDQETPYLGDIGPGAIGSLRKLARRGAHAIEGYCFRKFPALTARLRRNYNILVLAAPKAGDSGERVNRGDRERA